MADSGVNLLTGKYDNSLDEKGRILLPAKLRSGISGDVIWITQGMDRCLWLFTAEEWEKLSSRLIESASPFNARNLQVLRRFIGPAQQLEFDKSGRLSIPQSLREYASLSKECVILGVYKYVELWDAAAYNTYLTQTDDSFQQAAEELKTICF